MGVFSSCTGAVTLFMMLAGQKIFKFYGWGVAALITPTMLFVTGDSHLQKVFRRIYSINSIAKATIYA